MHWVSVCLSYFGTISVSFGECVSVFLLWRISLFWMARSMTREKQKMNIRNKIVSIEISKANVAGRQGRHTQHSALTQFTRPSVRVCVYVIAEKNNTQSNEKKRLKKQLQTERPWTICIHDFCVFGLAERTQFVNYTDTCMYRWVCAWICVNESKCAHAVFFVGSGSLIRPLIWLVSLSLSPSACVLKRAMECVFVRRQSKPMMQSSTKMMILSFALYAIV